MDLITYKNLVVIPSFHSKINFAREVRKVYFSEKPDAIAVELPESVKDKVIQGVKRLPKLSMVLFKDEVLNSYLFVPIEPGDSIIEGVRLSVENNVSCYFIDFQIRVYVPLSKNMPDDEAMRIVGIKKFYDLCKQVEPENLNLDKIEYKGFPENFVNVDIKGEDNNYEFGEPTEEQMDKIRDQTKTLDAAREYFMACNLKQLMEDHQKIMVIVGLSHWERIKALLESDVTEPLNTDILQYSPGSIESLIYNVGLQNVGYVMNEVPFGTSLYEKWRQLNNLVESKKKTSQYTGTHPDDFDRLTAYSGIMLKAKQEYVKKFDEDISIQQSLQLMQYLRNLVAIDNRLTPDVYHLVVAAKNVVNDDFAWYVYKTANYYAYAVESDEKLPTIEIHGNKFKLDEEMVLLRRRIPIRMTSHRFKVRKVREEKPGENWKKEWDKNKFSICSWPEEDLILEEHYGIMRQTGHRLLTEKYTKTEKFEGSFLDGIDIRETIRNWGQGQHIFIKEIKRIEGDITNFLIIFDDEAMPPWLNSNSNYYDEKYPHNISFYAEHDKESDLAFFSTKPGVRLVGPGISVIKLGGFSSEYPPISHERMYWDVFSPQLNRLFHICDMKSERLLLNSIYQSKGKYILYIAKKPPRDVFHRIAHEYNKNIVYMPFSMFSPSTLERLKYMHIIAGKFRRKYAANYIDLKKRFRF